MTIEQVATLGGKFFRSSSLETGSSDPKASWFVPSNPATSVMVKMKDGDWKPRGF